MLIFIQLLASLKTKVTFHWFLCDTDVKQLRWVLKKELVAVSSLQIYSRCNYTSIVWWMTLVHVSAVVWQAQTGSGTETIDVWWESCLWLVGGRVVCSLYMVESWLNLVCMRIRGSGKCISCVVLKEALELVRIFPFRFKVCVLQFFNLPFTTDIMISNCHQRSCALMLFLNSTLIIMNDLYFVADVLHIFSDF